MSTKACVICGGDFDARGRQLRCDRCRVAKCLVCGTDFMPPVRTQKYCSYSCAGRAPSNLARIEQRRTPDIPNGTRFGRLVVLAVAPDRIGRDGKRYAMALCRCDCGEERVVYQSNLLRGLSTSCGCLGRERSVEAHRLMRLESPGYTAIHRRVKDVHGPAAAHRCPCGNRAAEWAYDNADPDEVAVMFKGRQMRASLKIEHYVAMCIPCHRRFDAEARRAERRDVSRGA